MDANKKAENLTEGRKGAKVLRVFVPKEGVTIFGASCWQMEDYR
jgi:hypothetical protein